MQYVTQYYFSPVGRLLLTIPYPSCVSEYCTQAAQATTAAFVLRSEDCLPFWPPVRCYKAIIYCTLAEMVKYGGVPDLIFTSRQVREIITALLCLDVHQNMTSRPPSAFALHKINH